MAIINSIMMWFKGQLSPKSRNEVETTVEASDSTVETKVENSCNRVVKLNILEINVNLGK